MLEVVMETTIKTVKLWPTNKRALFYFQQKVRLFSEISRHVPVLSFKSAKFTVLFFSLGVTLTNSPYNWIILDMSTNIKHMSYLRSCVKNACVCTLGLSYYLYFRKKCLVFSRKKETNHYQPEIVCFVEKNLKAIGIHYLYSFSWQVRIMESWLSIHPFKISTLEKT